MLPKKSIEERLTNFAGKKHFTGQLVHEAIKGYAADRLNLDISRDYYTRYELGEKLERVRDCSKVLELRRYGEAPSAIHNGNFCKMPVVCVSCADRASRKKKAIFKPRIEQAAARFKYIYMLTMTIKNGDVLEERLNALVNSKKRFRLFGQSRVQKMWIYQDKAGKWFEYDRKRPPEDVPEKIKCMEIKRNDSGEWGKVTAAISSTEIIWGEDTGVHCHEHAIIFSDKIIDFSVYDNVKKAQSLAEAGIIEKGGKAYRYGIEISKEEYKRILIPAVKNWYFDESGEAFPVSKVSEEWLRATKGQGVDIDVTPISFKSWIKDPTFKGEYCSTFPKWVAAHAAEVLKYNSKLAEGLKKNPISTDQYIELIQRRGNRRLFNTYGAFRNRLDSLYFSEEEEAYMDFVEWRDKQGYEIRRADFYDNGYHVRMAPEGKAVFLSSDKPDNERRYKLSKQADIVAWFRRVKAGALADRKAMAANTAARGAADTAHWKAEIENFINKSKQDMRQQLRDLWLNAIEPWQARKFSPAPF